MQRVGTFCLRIVFNEIYALHTKQKVYQNFRSIYVYGVEFKVSGT